jgi:hypothetical protein
MVHVVLSVAKLLGSDRGQEPPGGLEQISSALTVEGQDLGYPPETARVQTGTSWRMAVLDQA